MSLSYDVSLIEQAVAWYYNKSGIDCPSWLQYLGQGCSRTAYLIGDYVVKFDTHEIPGFEANEEEYTNYLKLRQIDLPDNAGLPETDLIYIDDHAIIIMEYISGHEESSYAVPRWARELGLLDSCGENLIYKDNKWWLIDLGVLV